MAAKGRSNRNWRHGRATGWTEYRYGDPTAKPITLAGKAPPPPVFRGDRRQHAIQQAMDALRDWRQTPFEHEGAVRAGIRSGLCLRGFSWHRSDAAAEDVIAAALRIMGAKRPSFEEGQRQYTTPRENCKWCGILLDEADQKYTFCSAEHARFAVEHWDFNVRDTNDKHYAFTTRMFSQLSRPKRQCANPQCDRWFYPFKDNPRYRYCSVRCARANRGPVTREYHRQCLVCGDLMVTHSPKATICSKRCRHIYDGWVPKALTRQAFDYFIAQPANARLYPRPITPELFDKIFGRAA